MHLFALLPAATLLLLWGAGETGLAQRVSCPAHCAVRVIVMRNRTVSTERGPQAEIISSLVHQLQITKPNVRKVKVQIGTVWVSVPAALKILIETAIKKYPEMKNIILEILLSNVAPPRPSYPVVRSTTKTTKRPPKNTSRTRKTTTSKQPLTPKPTKRKPTPKPQKTQPTPKPTKTKPTPKTPIRPDGKPTSKPPKSPKKKPTPKFTTTRATTTGRSKTTNKLPTRTKTTPKGKPHRTTPNPSNDFLPVPPQVGTKVPDVSTPAVVPPLSERINGTVSASLELLLNFPNHFATIYNILLDLGVKFPDLRKPVHNVTIGVEVIQLPKPIDVDFVITINGQKFHLPKETGKVATYISKHTAELIILVTMLHSLGSKFSLDKTGRIAGFELFGEKQNFPKALDMEVIVSTKKFNLPKDMSILLAFVKDKPAEFFKIEVPLKTLGVRFNKAAGGAALRATYRNKRYNIKIVPNVRIFVRGKRYDIPSDLDSLFKGPTGLQVGAILKALQLAKVPVNVDRKTGVVLSIVINKVTIPFPVALDLRLRLGSKVYTVPYDLPKIVAELEKRNMPSEILSILYSRYGVVPVHNNDNAVIALSFNGNNVLVKVQPSTVVIIAGLRFVLPKDAQKMIAALAGKKFTPIQMIQGLQLAGYTFLNEPDGVLRTIQKGAQRIELNMEMRFRVILNGKVYRVPNDLQRLMETVSKLHPDQILQIKKQLEAYGVIFSRQGNKMVLIFNGIKYEAVLKIKDPLPSSGLVINIHTQTFTIPKDINAAVSFATSNGPGALRILIELLKSHGIKVNLSPTGSVISIVFNGKVYTVGAATDDSIQVTIRGKQVWIPREMLSLPNKFKQFNFAELLVALIKKGANVEADSESNFYGFRFKGREVKFPKKFRIMVKVSKTGRKFRVPGQLGDVAKLLSKGKWDWKEVRATLRAAGIEVAGKDGPVKSFSFQGKKFKVG